MRAIDYRRPRLRRGANFLEFAIIMPFIMFFLVLSIDLGFAVLTYGSLQDATYSASRAGAQAGGANQSTNPTEVTGISAAVLGESVIQNPMLGRALPVQGSNPPQGVVGYEVVSGAKCTDGNENRYVKINTFYTPRLITPGLASIFAMANSGQDGPDSWYMSAAAVSRCEVVLP